ncbi:MAG TPA: hypothetical protein VLH79_14285 [Chthonomonadales bacterium]|nr:hypothetical protein [Chthonomonadales bacterium]
MRQIVRAALAVALIVAMLPAAAQNRGAVAVVPSVNASGERWEELKRRQTTRIDEWAARHLPAAGYSLAPAADVTGAVRDLEINLADPETWRTATFQQIGERMRVDYVLFCLVTMTEQKEQQRTWYVDREGRTDVRVWLIDVRAGRAVLGGQTFTGRSGGNRISIDNRGSDRQIQAAVNAVRDATRQFLAPYRVR